MFRIISSAFLFVMPNKKVQEHLQRQVTFPAQLQIEVPLSSRLAEMGTVYELYVMKYGVYTLKYELYVMKSGLLS